ncbi:unnamed protein product [Thlaspi arvense]|uniref:Uncharacterized protein n=1 Tax=Thlaspi arvense TaxID=13288 RepID=A0AAU9RVT6_THLAR|nr:unnamed protein product [Thlaspi arvense]
MNENLEKLKKEKYILIGDGEEDFSVSPFLDLAVESDESPIADSRKLRGFARKETTLRFAKKMKLKLEPSERERLVVVEEGKASNPFLLVVNREFSFPIKDHLRLGKDLDLIDFDSASEVYTLSI